MNLHHILTQEDDAGTFSRTAANLMLNLDGFGRFGSGGSEAERVGRAQVTDGGGTEVLFRAGEGPSCADRR